MTGCDSQYARSEIRYRIGSAVDVCMNISLFGEDSDPCRDETPVEKAVAGIEEAVGASGWCCSADKLMEG